MSSPPATKRSPPLCAPAPARFSTPAASPPAARSSAMAAPSTKPKPPPSAARHTNLGELTRSPTRDRGPVRRKNAGNARANASGGVMHENFRAYLDQLLTSGYSVRHDEHLFDPDRIDPGGNQVETWREDYPYDERLDRDGYEEEKYQLQIELLKFQYWAQDTGTKHVIVFEGRDAAGKGGTIKRFIEHLNPRAARVVALTKPTETERGQWYFHRY